MSGVKEFLQQVELCDAHINNKLEELAHLKTLAVKITTTMKQDVVSSSGNQDKVGGIVAKMIDLEKEINQAVDSFVNKKREVSKVIEQVNNPDYLTVLYKRYFFPYESFEKIACEMGYTYRNVCYLHGKALQAVEELIAGKG